ncbi:MAG: ABC transporter ATP-binding protein [Clostridiales bacterium]|jgi:ABC-type lipoprotein export system ATPase subunit|nr:ABC transporter ATP-binding protein [Clostridiales bacterium]
MIKVENIDKTFNPKARSRNRVLRDVSFELPDKGLVAIFGKSGSGKTTLLNIMGGLDKPDGGAVYIGGESLRGRTDRVRNARTGYIFQNYYLEKDYTIAEILRNQMIIAGFEDEAEIRERTRAALELVDMERYRNKQANALSGGQQQRVAIARAIIKGSDVIFADEPTGNLDAQNTVKVMDILKEISKRQLVVLVTHETSLIEKYADGMIEIVDGEIRRGGGLSLVVGAEKEMGAKTAAQTEKKPETEKQPATEKQPETLPPEQSENARGQNPPQPQPRPARPAFAKSGARKNGRLFTFKSVLKLSRSGGGERLYSTAYIFKRIFMAAMAIALCFFTFFAFEALNADTENKAVGGDSVYVDLNAYSDLRKIDEALYGNIDFFETRMRSGDFSYNNIASLSGIEANYTPKAVNPGDALEILYGNAPEAGRVALSRALADELKGKLPLKELRNDRSLLLMLFDRDFRVSGIAEGENPVVYMNKADYVNFLNVYSAVSFMDRNEVFFPERYAASQFTAEIREADAAMRLNPNQTVIEINRNSLYKMMPDASQADSRVNAANETLAKAATAIYIADSKPMYVKQFKVTRSAMTTDIIVYAAAEALNNIFAYLSPNLDALSSGGRADGGGHYFEINTEGGGQLADFRAKLDERGIGGVDILSLYAADGADAAREAARNLGVFAAVIALLFLIYYFIEKSGGIKTAGEYGVFRAIGVNRGNLLFKEAVTACMGNITGYFAVFLITAVLMSVRYAIMSAAFGTFLALTAGIFAASALLMVGISVLPYLFVLYRTPAQILAKYDV